MPGPLSGIRIIEIAGLGAAPFAAMMLADHGAEVIRVDRPGAPNFPGDPLLRSRRSVLLDLKNEADREGLLQLVSQGDGLIEGFRPGVMERLGLGPDALLAVNPALVYGRMTGWGQYGDLAATAGHDINYIALSGVLHAIGRAGEKPVPPLNLIGDFGGGGMALAFAMVSALLHVRSGGAGQVVDCAMTEGSALLMNMIWGFRESAGWKDERGANLLDTGAHFYDTYETADGKFIALGAIEPKFYEDFLTIAGLSGDPRFAEQNDPSLWPEQKRCLAEVLRNRSREEWLARFAGSDACVSPVLDFEEALRHPHNVERGTFVTLDGVTQVAPAPRYSRTVLDAPTPPREAGADQYLIP